jgi:hypothetical protein
MKDFIAAILMLGPFATQADIDQSGRVYARMLYDCGIWVAADVQSKNQFTEKELLKGAANFARIKITSAHNFGLCIDGSAENRELSFSDLLIERSAVGVVATPAGKGETGD